MAATAKCTWWTIQLIKFRSALWLNPQNSLGHKNLARVVDDASGSRWRGLLSLALTRLTSGLQSPSSHTPWPHDGLLLLPDDVLPQQQQLADTASRRDIFEVSVLLAVPKKRRSLEINTRRRRVPQKRLYPKEDLLTCQNCGHYYERFTICGNCYSQVRTESRRIRDTVHSSTLHGAPHCTDHRPLTLIYDGERVDGDYQQQHRVVEMPSRRPAWFSAPLYVKAQGTTDHSTDTTLDTITESTTRTPRQE